MKRAGTTLLEQAVRKPSVRAVDSPDRTEEQSSTNIGGGTHNERTLDRGPRIKRVSVFCAIAAICLAVVAIEYLKYLHIESTDDAYIDGHIFTISSRISGTVLEVQGAINQYVSVGSLLLTLDPAEYQLAVDHARAEVTQAQGARSAATHLLHTTSIEQVSALQEARLVLDVPRRRTDGRYVE